MLINMTRATDYPVFAETGIDVLRSLSVKVQIVSPRQLKVDGNELQLHLRQRVPSPAELERQSIPNSIYFVSHLTPGLRRFAKQNKTVSLVATKTKEVWLFGTNRNQPEAETKAKLPSSRAPWAKFALLRSFALNPRPRTQADLAESLGITQAAVSQNLATLKDLVEKTSTGWRAQEFDLVLSEYLESYPAHSGIERYWFGIEPVGQQVSKVLSERPEAVLSGDFAADLLAPWRMPNFAVFYSRSGLNLQELGFIETTQDRATLVEITPLDQTIWQLAKEHKGRLLADPLIVAHDMKRSKGVDTPEAIEHLVEKLRKDFQQDGH
jgi:hypothetical protein